MIDKCGKERSMDKKLFKSLMWLITAAVVIVVCVLRFDRIVSALSLVLSLLSPLIVGLIIAFILNPAYEFFRKLYSGESKPKLFAKLGKLFRRKKAPKPAPVKKTKKTGLPKSFFPTVFALVTTYLIFLLIIILLFSLLIPQLAESFSLFSSNLETYLSNLKTFLDSLAKSLNMEDTLYPAIENTVKGLLGNFSDIVVGIVPRIFDVTVSIALWTANIIIGFVLSVYILAGKKTLSEKIRNFTEAFFDERTNDRIYSVSSLTYKTFSGFITGRLLDASCVGVLCFIGMLIFGFDYPLLISVIIGVTNIIPFFGPFIGGVPAAFILLMIDPWEAVWFVVFLVILQQLDGNIIGVRIVGDSVGLPPLWSLVAILVGGGLFGFAGMILGTPAFGVLYTLLNRSAEKNLQKKHIISK